MKLLRAAVATGLVLGLAAPQLTAQARSTRHSAKETFTSPDGVFQFEYPKSHVLCGEDTSQPDQDPDHSCQAYTPVCTDSAFSGGTLACVAYPAGKYRNTNFEAAAFSVSELEKADTESKCLSHSPDLYFDSIYTETINGVTFKVFHGGGAALSHQAEEYVYRNFHGKKCYELSIRIATSNFKVYEPGAIEEFTSADLRKVYRNLKRVLRTFRFLK